MDVRLPNGQIIRGVPEGTPKEQIQQKAINAGLATPTDFGDLPEEMGFIDTVKDIFTGESRETRATQELPELESALIGGEATGFLSTLEPAQAAQVAGTIAITEDPQERAKILQKASPDFGIQYDEKGNVIAANNRTGQRVVLNRPGLSASDLFPAFGQFSASLPTALAGGPAAITAATGATTAAIEGAQAAAGGEFNVENVVLDLVATGALEAVGPYLRGVRDKQSQRAATLQDEAVQAEAERVGQQLSPEQQLARQTELTEEIAKQSQARRPELRQVASDVAPDQEVLAAAERLGVADELTPGQVSGSQTYRELEGAISAVPASQLSAQQKQAASSVAQKADDLIIEFGGTTDKAALSEQIKDRVMSSINDLDKQADIAYTELRRAIPANAPVDTKALTDILEQSANELGGVDNLEPFERRLFDIATSSPTYARLDLERRKVGQALNKASGPYKDSESGSLKRMYSILTDIQEGAAGQHGAADLWNSAKQLVSQRKRLEENSISLLGRDLSGSIIPKVGASLKKLSTGDYKNFDNIMSSLPKDEREKAVLTALNDVFTAGSRAEKQLSPAGFVDWYETLSRNKAAKRRVFNNLPDGAADRLNDIYLVSRGIRNLSKERVRTGVIQGLLDDFDKADGMLAKIYQTGTKVAAAEGATATVGFPGAGTAAVITEALTKGKKDPIAKSADELLSSSEFKRAVSAYADTSVRAQAKQKAAERALEKSEKYQRWLDLLPSDQRRAVIRSGLVTWLSGTDKRPQETQQ